MNKANTIAQLAAVAYGDTPCLEAMPYEGPDAWGAAWVTWTRTVRSLMLAYPSTFEGYIVTADARAEYARCFLLIVPNTKATHVKFEGQPVRVTPNGNGLTVTVPGHREDYRLPMCCPAEFAIWLCQIL